MYKFAVCLVGLAVLALAGCGSSEGPATSAAASSTDSAGNGSVAAPAAATSVTGTVALHEGSNAPHPSSAAQLELSLVDISRRPALTIADKVVQPLGTFPIEFKLDFNPTEVVANDIYELRATITDGDRQYTMPLSYPVLTHGRPATAAVTLTAQPTPSEAMLADFKALEASIGGMKIQHNTSLTDTESHGWQTFRDQGELKFVRDSADFTAGGSTDTDYAYANGLPVVVVRKHMAKRGAAVDSIERAGWKADGTLVLHDKVVGGKTTALSEAAAKTLFNDAQSMFKRVGGNKY